MGDPKLAAENKPAVTWIRRLTKWALILLAVIVVVRIADYGWFRSQVPLRFTAANWSGTWKTQQYGLTGRLLVHLPDPLPENEHFQAEALVYYPIYSVWKTGQFVKMEFAGNFSPESSTSAGITENEISGSRGKLKFKATAGIQVVDYVAMMDESGNRVIGSYVSKSPSDIGYFLIQNY